MTKHYTQLISFQNLFRTAPFPEDIRLLTEAEVDEIKQILESKLSPENLHCDGEISHQEAQNKFNSYLMVCREITVNTSFEVDFNQLSY